MVVIDQVRPVSAMSPLGRFALAPPRYGAHVFQAQTEIIQQRRIHVDAHARQRTARRRRPVPRLSPAQVSAAGS